MCLRIFVWLGVVIINKLSYCWVSCFIESDWIVCNTRVLPTSLLSLVSTSSPRLSWSPLSCQMCSKDQEDHMKIPLMPRATIWTTAAIVIDWTELTSKNKQSPYNRHHSLDRPNLWNWSDWSDPDDDMETKLFRTPLPNTLDTSLRRAPRVSSCLS